MSLPLSSGCTGVLFLFREGKKAIPLLFTQNIRNLAYKQDKVELFCKQ